MASARDIKSRIKGVKGTGKVTRAMEMISAVKMRKAVQAVSALRPYAESVMTLLSQLQNVNGQEHHPLLATRSVKSVLYVVITSNRGLCGAFNAQVAKRLRSLLAVDGEYKQSFVTIGKKGEDMIRRLEGEIIASFSDILTAPTTENMRPVVRILLEEFISGRIDRVVLIYTDYLSVLSQAVSVRNILPVTWEDTASARDEMGGEDASIHPQMGTAEYIIEPSPHAVLSRMVPYLLEMRLYHAILESNASQEASRMMAMRNATNATKDMVSDLTLTYNQIRQAKITQEIAELSAGMAAVTR
ncbi:MAG: ATP synthase F1 subunit gamma [Minisyncoccota bacterium]